MHVLIAGGGLGGLLLAHSLRGTPHTCSVLERDASPLAREQGLVIGLAQEGVDALVKAGLAGVCRELFAPDGPGDVFIGDQWARCLIRGAGWLRVSLPPVEPGGLPDVRSGLVDRALLRRALAAALPEGTIRWGARVAGFREEGAKIAAVLDGGGEEWGDVLVGADGARSAVRKQLAPALLPKELGIYNTAGTFHVAPGSPESEGPLYKESLRSLVRLGGLDGASLLLFTPGRAPGSDRSFTLWALTAPLRHFDPSADSLPQSIRILESHFRIPEAASLVSLTQPADVYPGYEITSVDPSDLAAFPIKPPGCRATLLGDAAHKTTTQAGLGASAAFSDALELASALRSSGDAADPTPLLRGYEAAMAARAKGVVAASAGNTRRLHAEMGWAARAAAQWVMWAAGWAIWGVGAGRVLVMRLVGLLSGR